MGVGDNESLAKDTELRCWIREDRHHDGQPKTRRFSPQFVFPVDSTSVRVMSERQKDGWTTDEGAK